MDFVSYPLGEYTVNNLKFVEGMNEIPKIYSTNYFLLTPEGKFCTEKTAKKVWLHWAEGRIHGEYDTFDTPTGKIPLYKDLKVLFKKFLDIDYKEDEYTYQFTFRCDKWIEKLERSKAYFAKMDPNCPEFIFQKWDEAIARITKAKEKYGDQIKPGEYAGV
jgi:phosphoenolpyruvate carboxykinase (GTP)